MRHTLCLATLLAFSLAQLPPASALADACQPFLAGGAGAALTASTHVVGTLTWVGPMVTCASPDALSLAAPCPTGLTLALPGVYCGPLLGPGGTARCVWEPLVGGPSGLLVGFDLPTTPVGYDGNLGFIGSGEATVYASVTPKVPFTVTNPSASVGKLMAFPYNAGLGPSPGDVTMVSCS